MINKLKFYNCQTTMILNAVKLTGFTVVFIGCVIKSTRRILHNIKMLKFL